MSKQRGAFIPPHTLSELPPDTPLLLGLSGGADSCALFHMLLEYCKEHRTPLTLAHVDHGIRGEEAKRDAAFCRALAEKHSLPFHLLEADVPALAKASGRSIEEEARAVRYVFFERVMKDGGIPLLVTAHNADDNAETLLFRLARGTAVRGLSGIPPVRPFGNGRVIRPLLEMTKADILSYCKENSIDFVTDSTNECTDYARNRIRHNALPELCAINGNAVENISRLAHSLRTEEDYWRTEVGKFLSHHATKGALSAPALLELHEALGKRVLATFLEENGIEPSATAIGLALALARSAKPHASLDLTGGTLAYENGLLVTRNESESTPKNEYCIPVTEKEIRLPDDDMCLLWEKDVTMNGTHEMCQIIYKKATTTKISFDTINGSLFIRPRRSGDTILVGGMHKKVKKLFCEKKIPLALRDRLPLLCDGDGIVWIPLVALRDGADLGERTETFTLLYN